MFDIGFWEILLILVLALIIIGPERLPGAARKVGYWVGRGRRFIEGVRNDVESEVDLNEFKRLLHNQEVQINELQQRLKAEVTEPLDVRTDQHGEVLTDVPSHSYTDAQAELTAEQVAETENTRIETDDWAMTDEADESAVVASEAADKHSERKG